MDKSEPGYKTDQLIHIDSIKGNAVILKSEKYEVVINEKLLNNFDKNCTFQLSGELSPVYVQSLVLIVAVLS